MVADLKVERAVGELLAETSDLASRCNLSQERHSAYLAGEKEPTTARPHVAADCGNR